MDKDEAEPSFILETIGDLEHSVPDCTKIDRYNFSRQFKPFLMGVDDDYKRDFIAFKYIFKHHNPDGEIKKDKVYHFPSYDGIVVYYSQEQGGYPWTSKTLDTSGDFPLDFLASCFFRKNLENEYDRKQLLAKIKVAAHPHGADSTSFFISNNLQSLYNGRGNYRFFLTVWEE